MLYPENIDKLDKYEMQDIYLKSVFLKKCLCDLGNFF